MYENKRFDIMIVGAGIVGLTAALAFSRIPQLSIAVIDSQPIHPKKTSTSQSRVSAITQVSKTIFKNLDAWPKANTPFKQISIWDDALQACHFSASDVFQSELGAIVENDELHDTLLQKVLSKHQITLLPNVSLTTLENTATGVLLNGCMEAKLLCGADGGQSWVRTQLNFPIEYKDYEQSALIATVTISKAHANIAKQFFIAGGPLAFLPLEDPNTCSIVWSAQTEKIANLMAMSDDAFNAALFTASHGELGRIKTVSVRLAHALKMQHTKQYVTDHVALLGDAAHSIHPLAGLGLNMGVLDVARLYDVVAHNIEKNRRYYSCQNLRAFERIAKVQNAEKIKVVGALKAIFDHEKNPLPFWRGLGLSLLDQSSWIKNICIGFAMGSQNDAPTLAKSSLEDALC